MKISNLRHTAIAVIFILQSNISFSQGVWNFGYDFLNANIPIKSEMPKMSNVWGIFGGLHIGYQFSQKIPISLDIRYMYGSYNGFSNYQIEHTMLFSSGNETQVLIDYYNSMNSIEMGLKFNFFRTKRFSPYVHPFVAKTTLRTRINVADPEDDDDCLPAYSQQIIRHNGLTYGAKAGVDIRLGKEPQASVVWFFNVGFLTSPSNFNYVNQKHMDNEPRTAENPNHTHNNHGQQGSANAGTVDIYHDFINVFTSDVHAHKVAESYSSRLMFITFSTGMSLYFNRKNKKAINKKETLDPNLNSDFEMRIIK